MKKSFTEIFTSVSILKKVVCLTHSQACNMRTSRGHFGSRGNSPYLTGVPLLEVLTKFTSDDILALVHRVLLPTF